MSDGPSSLFTLINDGDGIVSRCDLSVVCYDSPRDLRYLSHEENGGYGFMEHRLWLNIDSAVDRILEDDPDNWELIRYRYLQLKNSGRRAEIPYLLFADAVESVHRRLFGDSDG